MPPPSKRTAKGLPGKPWDRRDGETQRAYGAFQLYLKMPAHKRTWSAAFAQYAGPKAITPGGKIKTPSGTFMKWTKEHDWEGRAKAFDDDRHKREMGLTSRMREEILLELLKEQRELLDAIKGERAKGAADLDSLTRAFNAVRAAISDLLPPKSAIDLTLTQSPVTPLQIRPQLDPPPSIIKNDHTHPNAYGNHHDDNTRRN